MPNFSLFWKSIWCPGPFSYSQSWAFLSKITCFGPFLSLWFWNFKIFFFILLQHGIAHLCAKFQHCPSSKTQVMMLFLRAPWQFWSKNGHFWAKIRHYGFLVQNFCLSNIALNSTDHLSPKPASTSKRFWKYSPKTAKIRPKSKKSASESESGPPFWNRSRF